MDEKEIVNADTSNGTEGTEETNEEVVADTTTEETEEPEYSDNEKKLYARAKQAEAELKELKATKVKPTTKPSEQANLSSKDTYNFIKADVHPDDYDEVLEIAKLRKITPSEALALNLTKTLLREKAEERKTASATNTGTARRGTSKASDETLMEKARGGVMPDTDADLARLIASRRPGVK